MDFYHASPVDSELVALIHDGVTVKDLTNPSVPTSTTFNWVTDGGYADGDALDGSQDGSGNDRTSLTLTIKNGQGNAFATIWQNGVAVTANAVPFTLKAVAPTNAILLFNVPRTPGSVYHCTVSFRKPTGEEATLTWDITILGS